MPDAGTAPCCPELTPLEKLEMCQVEFWLHIMRDHAMFIDGGLPCDAGEQRTQAQRFLALFNGLIKEGGKIKGDRAFRDYVRKVKAAVRDFCHFKTHLLHLTVTCQLPGTHLPAAVLAHVRREALYFLGLLGKIANAAIPCPVDVIAAELAFWTEIMKEHLAVNDQLVDPSEAKVRGMLVDWLHTFDALATQSQALQDYLRAFLPAPDLLRLIEDTQQDTSGLRDFQTSLVNLINQCRLLQVMPSGFVAHQNRETEHFLQLLPLLRDAAKQQKEPCHIPEMAPLAPVAPGKPCGPCHVKVAPPCPVDEDETPSPCTPSSVTDEDETPLCTDSRDVDTASAEEELEEMPAVQPPPLPDKPCYPAVSPGEKYPEGSADSADATDAVWKPGKYKWSGHWPRPLGKQEERGREKKRR